MPIRGVIMKRKSKSMMNIQKKLLFAVTMVALMTSQSCFAAEESIADVEAKIDKATTGIPQINVGFIERIL